jgi:hypothetical protein
MMMWREADQDDTSRFDMTDEDQPAKVFILCQQDAFLATGLINQFAVVGAARYFSIFGLLAYPAILYHIPPS